MIALIVPPLPAVSRPSKTMQTFAPVAFTHSCMCDELTVQPAQFALVLLALHLHRRRLDMGLVVIGFVVIGFVVVWMVLV